MMRQTVVSAHVSIALLALCAMAPTVKAQQALALQDSAVDSALKAGTGSLAIRAVQGTPDAPPVTNVDVEIDLLHRGVAIKTLTAKLDEFGVVVLDDLPIAMGVQPLVRVHYAGVMFQQIGVMMDTAHPQQKLDVTCYEVTSDRPDWSVHMRHVMVTHASDGIRITELIILNNPGQRAWLGAAPGDERPITTSFGLPTGATDMQLGRGFHDWSYASFDNARLSSHLPLLPGPTELSFSYALPSIDGTVVLNVSTPVPVDNVTVTIPDDMKTTTIEGLDLGGQTKIADTFVRYYTAEHIEANQVAGVTFVGLRGSAMMPASTNANTNARTTTATSYIAAIGGGLILVGAVVLLVFRSPKPTPES